MKLTHNQRSILDALRDGPKIGSQITSKLNSPLLLKIWTYDQVHSSLRRLEDRNLVRRVSDPPTLWEMTRQGSKALLEDSFSN